VSGSEAEPLLSGPEQAAEQMRGATDRLREQGWMVAPLTSPDAALALQPSDQEMAS
jgi:hypothetical protein